jgi:NAD(P)-dependent dehydrogenase (short-subunit alcohol dehydrogenase family)
MRLQDKVIIITGAGSGTGRSMATLFGREGARVVAADWHAETLSGVVDEVRAAGGLATGVHGNVAREADCAAIVQAALDAHGRVDALVNNAGVMDTNQGVGELDNVMWERVLGINLNGPMYLSRLVVPRLVAQGGGAIVNVASVAGVGGGAAGAAYTTSKHALVGLTKNTAFRYALDKVRCNAIIAGAIATNIMQSVDASQMDAAATARYQTWYGAIPATLDPIDIAELTLFLVSDASRCITGACIAADGGWTAA